MFFWWRAKRLEKWWLRQTYSCFLAYWIAVSPSKKVQFPQRPPLCPNALGEAMRWLHIWPQLPSKAEIWLRLPLTGKSFNPTRMRKYLSCSFLSWARWQWQDCWFSIQSGQHMSPTQFKWRARQRVVFPPAQRGRHMLSAYKNGCRMSFSRTSQCHFYPCVRCRSNHMLRSLFSIYKNVTPFG